MAVWRRGGLTPQFGDGMSDLLTHEGDNSPPPMCMYAATAAAASGSLPPKTVQ